LAPPLNSQKKSLTS